MMDVFFDDLSVVITTQMEADNLNSVICKSCYITA